MQISLPQVDQWPPTPTPHPFTFVYNMQITAGFQNVLEGVKTPFVALQC